MTLIDQLDSLSSTPADYRAAVRENLDARIEAGDSPVEAYRSLRYNLDELYRHHKRVGGESILVVLNSLINALLTEGTNR